LPPEAPNPPLDLEELVKTKGAMDLAKTVALGIKLAGAVKYAHKRGVIHRDIKPANILFNEDWEPKLADFGLARQVNLQQEGATLAGAQLLTLGYGAPEQEVDASKVDERADIYGMGGTLWFALSGQNPRFFRESEVPELLRPVLAKALHKDREKRFQTAADFEQTLSQLDSRLKQAPVAEAPAEDKKDDGFRTFADRVATLRSESRYPEAINSLRAMTLSVDPKQRKLVQWAEKELPVVQQEYAAAQKKRDDAVRQATQWIAAARCAEAVNLLNGIPLAFHNPELVDVLERAKTVLGQAKSPAKSMDDIVSMLGGEVLAEPARPIASMSGHRRSEETRKLLVTIIAAAATVAGLLLMALLVRASLSGNGSPPQVASDESKSAGAAEGGNKSRSEEAGAASTDLENKSQERNPQESSAASDSREAGMDSKSPAVLPPSPSGAGSEPSVGKPSAADRQAGMLSEPATKAPSPPFASKAADRPAAPNLPADASADDSSAERPPATANMRIWRDASGEHETEAE
jgi:serine/threonine protein kinase